MLDLVELVTVVETESNCSKPTVCILISKQGRVVASGANYCEQKVEVHAEVVALRNMEKDFQPFVAMLKGEYCEFCIDKLKKAGVEHFKVL